jgi:heme/copper-type cytochrome/quinol oxidase subunit 2
MDTTQILFTVVLTVTTIFLVVIGIQLIFVLKELREALKKINNIIENFEKIGGSFEQGVAEIIGFVSAVKSIIKLVDLLHKKKNDKQRT